MKLDINQAGTRFTLLQDVHAATVDIIVPEGYVCDLASIPKILFAIWSPVGDHKRAAIIHDWIYDQHHRAQMQIRQGGSPFCDLYTRAEADLIFLRELKDDGISIFTWLPFYCAVRWFGDLYWNKS